MRIPKGATHYIHYTSLGQTDYFRLVNGSLQVYRFHRGGWVYTHPYGGIDVFLSHPLVKKLVVEPKVFSYEHA